MRAPGVRLGAGLAAAVLLAGCGGSSTQDSPTGDASSSAAPAPSVSAAAEDEQPLDTYADVEPATEELDVSDLPAVASVAVWKGAEVLPGPSMVTAGIEDRGPLRLVNVSSRSGPMVAASTRAQRAYWLRHHVIATGPVSATGAVVVDGHT